MPLPAAAYRVVAAPCTSSSSASGRTVPAGAMPPGTPVAASSACSRAKAPMASLGGSAAIVACISATRSVIVDGLVIAGLLPLAVVGRRGAAADAAPYRVSVTRAPRLTCACPS